MQCDGTGSSLSSFIGFVDARLKTGQTDSRFVVAVRSFARVSRVIRLKGVSAANWGLGTRNGESSRHAFNQFSARLHTGTT